MTVSVVIPLYNEEENIEMLHERLKDVLNSLDKGHEIIYVDDGSTDRTLEFLEGIQKREKDVMVLSLRRNFGQPAAFAAGFDFARGDVIVTMDGDLQNDPADIPRLLEMAKEYDLVSGWRKKRKDNLFTRRIPSSIANWLISTVTGVRLRDYGCSLKAYRRDVIKNLRLYGEMHRFVPAIASWYGVSIAEVETTYHPRLRGKSKHSISKTIRILLDLMTVKFLQSFSLRPMRFFATIGMLSGLSGIVIFIYLIAENILRGTNIGDNPLFLLGILLTIAGVQFIGMGLLGEMIVRAHQEGQKRPIYAIKKILGPGGKRSRDEK
ncbi:glycosyltransferase family 2 protein [Thermodesulfovibrionales bacterium]|nr:glycosyltransferase family 2 protein [Thermodesulfovibrionales bacterium]